MRVKQDRRKWAQYCREQVEVQNFALVYQGSYSRDGMWFAGEEYEDMWGQKTVNHFQIASFHKPRLPN